MVDMHDDSDVDLEALLPAAVGDEGALATLLETLHKDLLNLVRSAGVRSCDLEDAVQDSILIVLRCVHDHDPRLGTFKVYALASVRKSLRRRPSPRHLPNVTEPRCEDDPLPFLVRDLLEPLPGRHRDLIRDRYGFGDGLGLTVPQISARRGLPESLVRRTLAEAFDMMRTGDPDDA